ncbi:uncharacterized protein LOC129750887 [Uranotaenia lowii]|uniref:uncharacterized protein LOC129750887 n=1 Tax=Uranotaenia lowii TaxID=190385 RepID=UPI00247A9FE7|nr:uncharacterized protein LOC129750887 [Uranotaenia lowii]
MLLCSNCQKQIPVDVESLNPENEISERDVSFFLLRLTQEIVLSRNYSEDNINRLCQKHYENCVYPDKTRLLDLIDNLKDKLLVQKTELLNISEEDRCVCPVPKPNKKGKMNGVKRSSTDSSLRKKSLPLSTSGKGATVRRPIVNRLPDMKVNVGVQPKNSKPLPKLTSKKNSADSSYDTISTITTYDFSSSSGPRSSIKQIMAAENGMELTEGCCGCGGKDDDQSTDMMLRMAASGRVFDPKKVEPKCPLERCEHFPNVSAAGGCGAGCPSDHPLPSFGKPDGEDSVTGGGCCGGKRKKKKKDEKAKNSKNSSKKGK